MALRSSPVGLLLLACTACASTRMSTRDIYAELLGSGLTCTPVAVARLEQRQDERFRDRMVALRPWLEAQIGAAEMARMRDDYDREMGSVEFIGCPSEEEHSHHRTRNWTLLHELETRSRHRPPDRTD